MLMLPILMYHKVDTTGLGSGWSGNCVLSEQLDGQLRALKEWGYTTVTLEDWLDFRVSRRSVPKRPVVLTFDDGYLSTYQIAWPLLRRHGAVANIFLVADRIGKTNSWDLAEPQEPLLGVKEILQMQASGIRFGSHTCTHRSLPHLSRPDAFSELIQSKLKLEGILGRPVVTLAYPYNKQSLAVRVLAKHAGYRAAVLGRSRINATWTNPLALRRIKMDLNTTLEQLRSRLNWLKRFPGL